MDDASKKIVVGYCAAIILAVLVVPWKIDWHNEMYSTKIDKGYSFIFSPPNRAATIDFPKVALEFAVLTAGPRSCSF